MQQEWPSSNDVASGSAATRVTRHEWYQRRTHYLSSEVNLPLFSFFAYRVERASGFCTISLWEHVFLTSSPFPRTLVQGLAAASTAPRLERSSQGHRLSYSGAARVSQPQTDASRYLKEISGSRAPKAICRRQRHCNGPWYTTGSRRSHVPQPMQQVRSTRILCSSHAPTPCFPIIDEWKRK